MPLLVAKLLDQAWFIVFGRIVLTFAFWGSGVDKLIHCQDSVSVMEKLGVAQPILINALTVTCQIGGSFLIIFNRFTWMGAGALGVFTLLTIPMVHRFWAMSGEDAIRTAHRAMEHVTVVGGLMIVAILSRYSGRAGNGTKNACR